MVDPMATVTAAPTPAPSDPIDQRIVLRGIDWKVYENLAAAIGDQHVRLTYDRGTLELMSPSNLHERLKTLMGHFVEALLFELKIPYECAGETRWEQETVERALEADECYFINPAKLAVVSGRPKERPAGPFPDLVIEVELTRGAINKLGVYADLGVAEVWRVSYERVQILGLSANGTYESLEASQFLPIHPQDLSDWILRADNLNMYNWLCAVRGWIQTDVVHRRPGGNS